MTAALAYQLPTPDAHEEWRGHERRDFQPSARQQRTIEAVAQALAAGMFYTRDIYAFCLRTLMASDEQAAVGARHVEGGEFGMDCYYARGFLRARERFTAEDQAARMLSPRPGQKLGTLRFNDFKRTTGAVVQGVTDNGRGLILTAKRGALDVTLSCDCLAVRYAMDRACERRQRQDDFAAYCKAQAMPARTAPQPADRRIADLFN